MPTPPDRHKAIEDYTPDEHLRALQAESRGEDYRPETDEYREYVSDGLRALGLDDEAAGREPAQAKPLEDMTPEDHAKEIRGSRL